MNVYDFDKTIYDGDSTVDFYLFHLRRHPSAALGLPAFAVAAARYLAGHGDKTELKEAFFGFLRHASVDAGELDAFWDAHMRKIKPFYLGLCRPDDVVASASPEFLLAPACARLGIRPPVASRVDVSTGRFAGPNCRGAEKVARLAAAWPDEPVENFYSDSRSDEPLAQVAAHAWLVRGDAVDPW